jgi:hypothetical protein
MCASVQVPTSAAAAAPLPAAPCRAADTDQQYSGPEWEQYKRDTAQVRWLQPALCGNCRQIGLGGLALQH